MYVFTVSETKRIRKTNRGRHARLMIKAPKLPIIVYNMAECPFPAINSLWPGSTDNA